MGPGSGTSGKHLPSVNPASAPSRPCPGSEKGRQAPLFVPRSVGSALGGVVAVSVVAAPARPLHTARDTPVLRNSPDASRHSLPNDWWSPSASSLRLRSGSDPPAGGSTPARSDRPGRRFGEHWDRFSPTSPRGTGLRNGLVPLPPALHPTSAATNSPSPRMQGPDVVVDHEGIGQHRRQLGGEQERGRFALGEGQHARQRSFRTGRRGARQRRGTVRRRGCGWNGLRMTAVVCRSALPAGGGRA